MPFLALLACACLAALLWPRLALADDDEESCECLASSCGACEIETGVKFYAAKCGPGLARVKSCKKPACAAVSNQIECLAALGVSSRREPTSLAGSANTEHPAPVEKPAARVVALEGSASIARVGSSQAELARLGSELRAGDTVETVDAGRAKLAFLDGAEGVVHEAVVGPRTRLTIEAHRFVGKEAARRTVLFLHQGGVRSSLRVSYDGKASDGERNEYLVRTRSAVAGVRGTDFLTTFDPAERDWKTDVRTFEGKVRLSGLEELGKGDAAADVNAGHEALYFAEGAGVAGASLAEQNAAVARGRMRQPWELKADELRGLNKEWSMKDALEPSPAAKGSNGSVAMGPAADAVVCSAPTADFNQCAWTCEQNIVGASTCRTDLPGVRCVRRVCSANGQWSDSTRMPASQGDFCDGKKPVVRPCDY
jgi:hypothetical protein